MTDPSLTPNPDETHGSKLPVILVGLFAIGGIGLVALVGILGFSTWNDFQDQVRGALEENDVVTEHLGEITAIEIDMVGTASEDGEDTFVFDVEGTRASGRVTVDLITLDADTEYLIGGTLRLDDGRVVPLGASWNRDDDSPITQFVTSAQALIEPHPAVVGALGAIESFDYDLIATGEDSREDYFYFDLRGEKGTGSVIAEIGTGEEGFELLGGELRLEDGSTVPISPPVEAREVRSPPTGG